MTKKKSETPSPIATPDSSFETTIGGGDEPMGTHTPLSEVELALENAAEKLLAMQHDAYSSWLALAHTHIADALDAIDRHNEQNAKAAE